MDNHGMKVVIVQSVLKHYRTGFFLALQDRLAEDGIDLRVAYSEPNAQEAEKGDFVEVNGGIGFKVRANWFFSNRLVYQHAWRRVEGADLVIVEQASKHLLNYALFASRAVFNRRVALWGHGFNSDGTRLGRVLRRYMLRLPDWWFAYTARSVRFLLANRVPAEIVTNVQNAIDTAAFAKAASKVTPEETSALRSALGIASGARVGLSCGSLYSHKHLPMLIASCALVRARVPDFHLIVVGDGPDRRLVIDAASRNPWIHYVGPKFGDDRAPYFRIAELLLNPGLVGLGILDGFAGGLPILTTDIPIHCPEIEYLVDGRNGLVTRNDVAAYAKGVVGTLHNPELMGRLREGACQSGRTYTLANMVDNFAGGVRACLERRKRQGVPALVARTARECN